jgi:hypothetical protein
MDNIVAAHLGVSGTLYEIPHRECCLMKIPRECMREVFQVCTGGAQAYVHTTVSGPSQQSNNLGTLWLCIFWQARVMHEHHICVSLLVRQQQPFNGFVQFMVF